MGTNTVRKKYRLAVLNSHPIQYFAPLYRRLAQEVDIDLTVYYCCRQGLDEYTDPGFGTRVQWDIPLLDGYQSKFLSNMPNKAEVNGFLSLVNLSIISELYRERYDALLVHGHHHVTSLLAITAAKLLGTAIFMRSETHLLLKRSALKQIVRRALMKSFYRICDVCLPIGSRNAEFYRYHGVPDERMFLVPYTVDNEFFRRGADRYRNKLDDVKHDLGLPADKVLIVYASKLTSRKHPLDLLMAYQYLREHGVSAALLFIGSGAEEDVLKNYATEHKIPDVLFFGFQNQSELPKFFACADIFVLPAENEPWGLIINEAMASGLPIIATEETGAVADLVKHDFNGLVFQTGNIQVLQQHLCTLITNTSLRKQMAENSRRIINSWGFEQCVPGVKAALAYIKQPSINVGMA